MSDPRNDAHAKKVTQEKKHQAAAVVRKDVAPTPPSVPPEPAPADDLDDSLVVLAKLKELEFHSRANLERLAALAMTVGDELKQEKMVGLLDEVSSAQNDFQTKLTTLIDAYKADCDRMRGARA